MSRFLWLLATVCQAQPPSDELNKQLPGWLHFGGEYRARAEGFSGRGFRDDNSDGYLLNRIRLNLTFQPSTWFKFVVQGQDVRVFWNQLIPKDPPYQDSMDLRMGYLELGDPETRAVSLRVGRQEINFGEQRLVGSTNWSNAARTFDALRATFRYHGYRLDAFAASVVVARDGAFNRSEPPNNLYGLYGSTERRIPRATIEPYVLWRVAPGDRSFETLGTRWVGKLPAGFDYGLEMAAQTGSLGADAMRAWAGHWIAGYTLRKARYTPRLIVESNYASGDRRPQDHTRRTFDHLYPTPHGKYGLADQVGWRNMKQIRGGVELQPHPKWQMGADYRSTWLASARDALYSSSGMPLARLADGSGGTYVGWELDWQALYTPSKPVQIGAGVGHLFPGSFLKKATPGKGFTYPYLLLNYTF